MRKNFIVIGLISIMALATIVIAWPMDGDDGLGKILKYRQGGSSGGGGGDNTSSPCRGTYPSTSCSEPTKKKCIESNGGDAAYACVHECANGANGYQYQPRYECGTSCTDDDCVIGV